MSPDLSPHAATPPYRPEPADCRVADPVEAASLLRELMHQHVHLTIVTPCGASYTTRLWQVDAERGLLRFSAEDRDDLDLARVIDSEDALAVGYLERIKVQFDVHGLVMVHTATGGSALNCALPSELFRFQRRHAYRVRPLLNTHPTARFPHPVPGQGPLELRVIDVSIGGVALFLPDGTPGVRPGMQLDPVRIELDGDTCFDCSLRVHHVTGMNPDSQGVRLGCEIEGIGSAAQRSLQRFIDQTQKRRRQMARTSD